MNASEKEYFKTHRGLLDWWKPDILKLLLNHDVEGLSRALDTRDENIHEKATFALVFLAGGDLKGAAAAALAKAKGSRSVESVIRELESDDKLRRNRAALALGKIGDPRAIDPLLEFMKRRNRIRDSALLVSLCEIGDERVIPHVLGILKRRKGFDDPNIDVFDMQEVATALGQMGIAAIEPLIQCLKFHGGFYSTTEEVKEAVATLGQPAIDRLEQAAQHDSNSMIRERAADILDELGYKAAEIRSD